MHRRLAANALAATAGAILAIYDAGALWWLGVLLITFSTTHLIRHY